jgi:membrane protein implicated in regulation of membrane protease activity
MNQDFLLLLIVAVVWAALAVLYAAVPMFHMPGYAEVWGWGALIFFVLAIAIAVAARRGSRERREPQ